MDVNYQIPLEDGVFAAFGHKIALGATRSGKSKFYCTPLKNDGKKFHLEMDAGINDDRPTVLSNQKLNRSAK